MDRMRGCFFAILLLLVAVTVCCSVTSFPCQADPNYLLLEAETRNIIFVGKSRSGKTTIVNTLKDVCHVAADMSFLRGTMHPQLQSFIIQSGKKIYNVNIMDTPGLFERTYNPIEDKKRVHEETLHIINKCVDSDLTKIHHVFFVISLAAGITQQDLDSFKEFQKLFIGMEDKISLIITFSEAYDEETKQNVISQITGDKELLDLFQMTKDRIFFMGSISVWESRSKDEIQKTTIAANVKQLRATLFEFIFAQNEYYDVKKLPLYLERLSLIDMKKEL